MVKLHDLVTGSTQQEEFFFEIKKSEAKQTCDLHSSMGTLIESNVWICRRVIDSSWKCHIHKSRRIFFSSATTTTDVLCVCVAFFCRFAEWCGYRLEPFLSFAVNHKSSTKRFPDISISSHHIILSSWITTNLSCFSSHNLRHAIQCNIYRSHFAFALNRFAECYVYDRWNAYFSADLSNNPCPIHRLSLSSAFVCSFCVLLFSWIVTWSMPLSALHFFPCLLLLPIRHSCVYDYIDLMVSNRQITLVHFTNSVNQWLFSTRLQMSRFCSASAHYMYATDLFRFLMRVFLLFDFDRIGKQRLWIRAA